MVESAASRPSEMSERGSHNHGSYLRKKPLFWIFGIATFLFGFSWFYFLGSTPRSIEPRIFSVAEGGAGDDARSPEGRKSPISAAGDGFGGEAAAEGCREGPRVFMYDLPPEFHFGLLDWKPAAGAGAVWPDIAGGGAKIPDYPGGLNLQHSIEYWLTLDLLSSNSPGRRRQGPCAAVRVADSRQADVVFVPFFSSLSYNRFSKDSGPGKPSRNKMLQGKLVEFLMAQEEWKRSGGRDHVVLAHHPNSMLDARAKLWPCLFVLSDFGRYPPTVANVAKDVIAPYKHLVKTYVNDTAGYDDRPTLLYFQGAIYRKDGGVIRQELFYLLRDQKDVHFSFGSIGGNGVGQASRGMHSSKFCLNIAGDTPSSNRLFDAIASHCVPVIISDDIELPFEDVLDYSEFCVFVRASDALKEGFLLELVRGITREDWTRMWRRLKELEGHFEFQYPSRKDDAVQMIWQAIARKVSGIRLGLNRSRRFYRLPPPADG